MVNLVSIKIKGDTASRQDSFIAIDISIKQ
jgi:hypothetical protein